MEFGVYGGILYCGQLEKRRDGAVRGGWALRTFLLTPKSLHYFRKITEQELLGEERGHIDLSTITSVNAMPESHAPPSAIEAGVEHYYLEINTSDGRSYLMRAPVKEASACESWSIAINQQCKVLTGTLNEGAENTSNEMPQETSIHNLVERPTSPMLLTKNHTLYSQLEASPPSIILVSVMNNANAQGLAVKKPIEIIKSHALEWEQMLDLGVLPQSGACILHFKNGGKGRIGTQDLMDSWDACKPTWIEVTDSDYPMEVQISVECKIIAPTEQPPPPLKRKNSSVGAPETGKKWTSYLDESCSLGFLFMCVMLHLLYGVDGFHWTQKCALTVGAALAITTILNGPVWSPPMPPASPRRLSQTNFLPALQFKISVHRCKIDADGIEFVYPKSKSSPDTE